MNMQENSLIMSNGLPEAIIFDTDNIAVNQLAHEYLTEEITGDPRTINNIIVDEQLFNKLCM